MVLFVNACVRKNSRTQQLAYCLMETLNVSATEVRLEDCAFPVADEAFINHRTSLIENGRLDDPMFALARQFASADEIIVAAPYWDLSFPASLKQYLEQINVIGLTFQYTLDGLPESLCKAHKLYYVTTVGGALVPQEYGFGYVKALAENFYGIKDVELIEAKGLDIEGADVSRIMAECKADIIRRFRKV